MNVPAAEVLPTAPKDVDLHSLGVTIPLRREGWLQLLAKHGLLVKHLNTQTFPGIYNTAQMLEYQNLHQRTDPQMIHPPSQSLPLLKRP